MDYDREADVLYISFQRRQKATDTKVEDEGILVRYRGRKGRSHDPQREPGRSEEVVG